MIFSMPLMYNLFGNNFKHCFRHHSSSEGGNFKENHACAITISAYYTLLDYESLIHVNLISLLFVNVIHVRHPPFPLNGVKKYLTGCCMVCSKICLYCWSIFVFCAGKHPCQDCVQAPWVSLWPAQQTWSRCTCRWKAEGCWRENRLGIVRPVYSYGLGLLGYFVRQHFQHMKKKKLKPEIFLDVLCSLVFSFPFWNMSTCKSRNPSLP